MAELRDLLAPVADRLLGAHARENAHAPLLSIGFYGADAEMRDDTLYLLDADALPALARDARAGVFVVACGSDAPALPAQLPPDCCVVLVREALFPLYAKLNRALAAARCRRRIDDILRMAEGSQYTPEQLAVALSELLNVGVYILNGAFALIGGSSTGCTDNPVAVELMENRALSRETVDALRSGMPGAALRECGEGKWSRFALLTLWTPSYPFDADYLCEQLSAFILRYKLRVGTPDVPPFLINLQMNRILARKVTGEAEIRSLFRMEGATAWYAMLVLRPELQVRPSADEWQKYTHLLRAAFRGAMVTVLDEQVCAVLRLPVRAPQETVYARSFFDERAYAEGWSKARLEQELRRCGVYLCISSVFRSWYGFSTMYDLVSQALEIGLRLDGCRGRHIVGYHDYNAYVSIKYSVERFLQTHEPRCIRMLLYPELVTLLFHDIEHHDELAGVLYRYYTYGDVKTTAQALFVHRNTVYNKLRAIQKLLGVDLDDPAIRSTYLTSLQVYYYCERCLGFDMRKLLSN